MGVGGTVMGEAVAGTQICQARSREVPWPRRALGRGGSYYLDSGRLCKLLFHTGPQPALGTHIFWFLPILVNGKSFFRAELGRKYREKG